MQITTGIWILMDYGFGQLFAFRGFLCPRSLLNALVQADFRNSTVSRLIRFFEKHHRYLDAGFGSGETLTKRYLQYDTKDRHPKHPKLAKCYGNMIKWHLQSTLCSIELEITAGICDYKLLTSTSPKPFKRAPKSQILMVFAIMFVHFF